MFPVSLKRRGLLRALCGIEGWGTISGGYIKETVSVFLVEMVFFLVRRRGKMGIGSKRYNINGFYRVKRIKRERI